MNSSTAVPALPGKVQQARYGMLWICFTIIVYTVVFFYLQLRLYEGLHMQMWDLGIFNQALHGIFSDSFLHSSFTGPSAPVFTEHMYLILVVLLPVYGLFPSVYTLFLVQAFIIAAGAIAVYLLARHFSGSEITAVLLGTAYLFYPSIQGMNMNIFMYGFHPDNLFPTFLLLAFYFFVKNKTRPGYVFAALALMCGEHLAPTVAALGLYLIWRHKDQRKTGTVLLVVSTGWVLLSSLAIIPYFRGEPPWYLVRAISGETEAGRVVPWVTCLSVTLQYIQYLLIPLLFTPLLDAASLLIAVPGLGLNYLACYTGYRTGYAPFSWHMAKVAPFIFLSATLGISRVTGQRHKTVRSKRVSYLLPFLVLIACILSSLWLGPWPWNPTVKADQFARLNPEKADMLAEAKLIIRPEDSLSTEPFWGSHFISREIAHFFPHGGWRNHDIVLVDTNSPLMTPWTMEQIEMLRASPDHQQLLAGEGMELYRFEPRELPSIQSPLQVAFANHMRLLGYNLNPAQAKSGMEITLDLFWTADALVGKSYSVFVHVISPDGSTVAQADGIPLNSSYPTDRWPAGTTMWDTHHLQLGENIESGTYQIKTGLYYWEDGKRVEVIEGAAGHDHTVVSLGSVLVEPDMKREPDGP